MTATPMVPASSRVVSFTAAPAPICSGASVLMSAAVEGAFTSEKPRASTIMILNDRAEVRRVRVSRTSPHVSALAKMSRPVDTT